MKKDIVGHCPYCTKMLFKEASFKDEADFETNCHHCGKPIVVEVQKELVVTIRPKIKVELPKQENSVKIKT